jgi:hypothetical protein
MPALLPPILRRSVGLIALALAVAVLLGSLCPRGWFVCLHQQTVALTDAGHATDGHGCVVDDGCGETDCCPGADGCLDLAISLVLDDLGAVAPVQVSLPVAPVIASLPDATHGLATLESPPRIRLGDPPLPDLIRHVRLLV